MADYSQPRPFSQPEGSTDLEVAKDNLITLDKLAVSTDPVTNRKGEALTSFKDIGTKADEAIANAVYSIGFKNNGVFEVGAVVDSAQYTLTYNGEEYNTTGVTFPYTATGSTPDLDPASWYNVTLEARKTAAIAINVPLADMTYGIAGEIVTPYFYIVAQEKIYSVPADAIGKSIVSVVGSTLNTTVDGPYQLESVNKSNLKMTLSEAITDTSLLLGDSVRVTDRDDGIFDLVRASTVVVNGFDIVQCDGAPSLALVLRIGAVLSLESVGIVTRPFDSSPDKLDFTPSADAFQRALDLTDTNGLTPLRAPKLIFSGDFYCEKEVTVPRFGTIIEGTGTPHKSRCLTFQSVPDTPYITIKHTDSLTCKNFSIVNTGDYIGFGFSTPQDDSSSSQAPYCEWDNVQVIGFYNSWWLRTSLWSTWKNCYSKSLCGIRFARNSNPYDLGLEPKNNNWNSYSPLGWFNNANRVADMVCEDIEVGIFGATMGANFHNLTCQKQTGDMADNKVLPVTEPRTGVLLTSGTDGVRDSFVNTFSGTLYAESCDRPLLLKDQSAVLIDSVFSQGGATDNRSVVALQMDNSFAKISSWTGQDWYETALILENGSELEGRIGGVATSVPKTVDATSVHYEKTNQEKFKHQYTYTSSLADSKALPLALASRSHYRLNVAALSNGTSTIYGNFHIYRHVSDATTVVVETTVKTSSFDVSVSGGQIVITKTNTTQLDFEIFLEELTESITDSVAI